MLGLVEFACLEHNYGKGSCRAIENEASEEKSQTQFSVKTSHCASLKRKLRGVFGKSGKNRFFECLPLRLCKNGRVVHMT